MAAMRHAPAIGFAFCTWLLASIAAPSALASELADIGPLTDRIIMLHFRDGHVVHHQRGQSYSDEKVIVNPLDTAAAAVAANYQITSADDPAYTQPQHPTQVGRKSKGTDFAGFTDKWVNNHAVNTRPDHTEEHWLYLILPQPMKPGRTYTVATGNLASNGGSFKLLFDQRKARSEALHVNLLGYVPAAAKKLGYVFHWMGDKGSLDVRPYENHPFHLIDLSTGTPAFTGKLSFRMPATQQETFHKGDSPPDGNYLKADVYECDFSSFARPGRYVLAVEGIGCSFSFRIDADVYREAFRTVARGLYHNRSGIALVEPYTHFTRPAPHNPKLTPGFSGKLNYTTVRFTEWGSEGGNAKALLAVSRGAIDSCGWYQDAGDWDSYYSHLRVPQELLLAYEMAPANFTDGELNIPESGNGVPDILDEAAWLPRFCYRLRHELMDKGFGTGGIGLRIAGDAFGEDQKTLPGGKKVGQGSWEDVNRTWAASGEDPWSTYRYAGAAAHLAYCLELARVKDPQQIDWAREAAQAYAWARGNTRPGDEKKEPRLADARSYAAAALFRMTGDKSYEKQFAADTADITPTTTLWDDRAYGPMIYALGGGHAEVDPLVHQRIRAAVIATADDLAGVSAKRALRWGGNWWMPMVCGQQTTPLVIQAAAGYRLVAQSDPARAQTYLATLYTTCDYFLGCNSLNMTWVTGLGPRYPAQVFHLDAWYNGKSEFHPGIIPYGPRRKEKDQGQGPWDPAWAYPTAYPAIDAWPANERWFDNRCCPYTGEFTIHQNTAPAAAIFGFLCAPAGQPAGK
jgi:endoglucanase